MKHLLPELPYALDALEPRMSRETLEFHYGKHLQTYIDNLNRLVAGTYYEELPLEDIVRTSDGAVFNNAAQTWNHTFFFQTLSPESVKMPVILADRLAADFGSVDGFIKEFSQAAVGLFGSGWAWLAQDADGRLVIAARQNAGNPMTEGMKPLMAVDVWEHAYYIDYRNRRADFVKTCLELTDWEKVESRLA